MPGSVPKEPGRLTVLAEPPHAHIVCRVCGRIATVALDTQATLVLEHIAQQRPEGWTVDQISFSLTGACARCRQGTRPTA